MNRLDFVLPDFTRVIWVSEQAKTLWEPRINRISNLFMKIQRESIISSVRDSALDSYIPEQLPDIVNWANSNNLVFLPLGINGQADFYSATPLPYYGGKYVVRAAITRPEYVKDWLEAWRAGDDKAIGQLLQYPDCCNEFFNKIWKTERFVDTTWPMAIGSNGSIGDSGVISVHGFDSCNILWRWLGVRTVPHLPCSFNCKGTVSFAQSLWINYSNTEEFRWLNEILSWPVEWSALHGIARIKTPICEISTRTDSTGDKYTVQREGTTYPVDGATGLVFPYQRVQSMNSDPTLWEDNGFKSLGDMIGAHSCIITLLANLKDGWNIVDAGCGNGNLLASTKRPFLVGVEIDHLKVERGQKLYPNVQFVNAEIQELPPFPRAVVLISVNRIKENKSILDWLKKWEAVIVYSYDGETPEFPLDVMNPYFAVDAYYNAYAKAILYRRRND